MAAAGTVPGVDSPLAQSDLWAAGARDWADVQEPRHRPLYELAIRETGIGAGTVVLDTACGAGTFCAVAAAAGADVTGIDITPALVEIARDAVDTARVDVGDIQALPYPDGRFDVVTGFNSFPYAADVRQALADATRVTRPGGKVFALIWAEETDLTVLVDALRPLLPADERDGSSLSRAGVLEELMQAAGMRTEVSGQISETFEYSDQQTLLRGLLAGGPGALAIRISGAQCVRDAVLAGLSPLRTASGGYRLQTQWRYVIGDVP